MNKNNKKIKINIILIQHNIVSDVVNVINKLIKLIKRLGLYITTNSVYIAFYINNRLLLLQTTHEPEQTKPNAL